MMRKGETIAGGLSGSVCRLIWSRNQYATGEIFLALKRVQEEPDATAAALVGLPLPAAAAATLVAAATATTSSAAGAAAQAGGSSTGGGVPGGSGPSAAGGGGAAASRLRGGLGGVTIATSAMVNASPAATALVAAQVVGGGGVPSSLAAASAVVQQEAVVNQAGIEFLRRLPGVTDTNWRGIMAGVRSLRELADCSVERLAEMMGGSKAAKVLHDFLHAPCPVA